MNEAELKYKFLEDSCEDNQNDLERELADKLEIARVQIEILNRDNQIKMLENEALMRENENLQL